MESQQTVKLQTIVSTKKKVRHMERKFSGRIAGCIQKIVLLTASDSLPIFMDGFKCA